MPVARKLWQLIVGGSPALLARRLIIWKTICLFMRVPLSRDLVTSSAWNMGALGERRWPVAVHVLTEVLDELVVYRYLVLLAALLVEQKRALVIAEAGSLRRPW